MDAPGSQALGYASFRKSYVRQSVYTKPSRFPAIDLLVEQHHMTQGSRSPAMCAQYTLFHGTLFPPMRILPASLTVCPSKMPHSRLM